MAATTCKPNTVVSSAGRRAICASVRAASMPVSNFRPIFFARSRTSKAICLQCSRCPSMPTCASMTRSEAAPLRSCSAAPCACFLCSLCASLLYIASLLCNTAKHRLGSSACASSSPIRFSAMTGWAASGSKAPASASSSAAPSPSWLCAASLSSSSSSSASCRPGSAAPGSRMEAGPSIVGWKALASPISTASSTKACGTPSSGRLSSAASEMGTSANTGQTCCRSRAQRRYLSLGTSRHFAFATSCLLVVYTTTKLSVNCPRGGGKLCKISPVFGCVRSTVFPARPRETSPGAPLPRIICRKTRRPRPSNMRAASLRPWNSGCSRPPHIKFARAGPGMPGCFEQSASLHSRHIQSGSSASPTPAQRGNSTQGCSAGTAGSGAPPGAPSGAASAACTWLSQGSVGTLRVCSNQR